MTTILTSKIGVSKGVPRIWLEGRLCERAGLVIGSKYRIRHQVEDGRLELIPVTESAGAASTCRVSKRVRKGIERPLMEIRTALLSSLFSGMEKVRVAIRKCRIVITALQIEIKIRERVRRLKLSYVIYAGLTGMHGARLGSHINASIISGGHVALGGLVPLTEPRRRTWKTE